MNLEYRAVSGLSSIAPWLAPVPSAFLVGRGLSVHLQFPDALAIISALGVEALGIAAINTALWLHNFNVSRRKTDPRANTSAAIWAAVTYLAVTTITNVLLDIGTRPALQIAAQGFLSILPISGALILATRAEHQRRLAEVAQSQLEAKQQRALAKTARLLAEPSEMKAEPVRYACEACGYLAKSKPALNAHQRKHSRLTNGEKDV